MARVCLDGRETSAFQRREMGDTRRWEPSTSNHSIQMSRTSSDSHVLKNEAINAVHSLRRMASARCQIPCAMDRGDNSVDIIKEEGAVHYRYRIPPRDTPPKRSSHIEGVLQRLKQIRQSMEEGMEEMQCQMYQIQYCNKLLEQERKERRHHYKARLEVPTTSVETPRSSKPPSARIPSCRDTWYDSTRSVTDQTHDYCPIVQKPFTPDADRSSVSPIHTPVPTETSEAAMHLHSDAPLEEESDSNNRRNSNGLRTPEVSAFRIQREEQSFSDRSGDGEPDSLFWTETSVEPSATYLAPREGPKVFKTDVVLNVQHSPTKTSVNDDQSLPTTQSKPTKLERFISLFCRRRLLKRHSRNKENREWALLRTPAKKKKSLQRWSSRSSTMRRLRFRTGSSGVCKFTDKYPIEGEDDEENRSELLQCFDTAYRGNNVVLETESIVSSPFGSTKNFAISEDVITNGIACFDLTCLNITDWCFIGVVGKHDVSDDMRSLSQCQTAHGFSNQSECFKRGMPHFISDEESFKTGTNVQLFINAEAGTLHFRFPKEHASETNPTELDVVEREICSLPKGLEWSLAIEWQGKGSFELNSVHAWK